MDTDVKSLVKRIISDREAIRILAKALATNTEFARDLTKELSKAVDDGCFLRASECGR